MPWWTACQSAVALLLVLLGVTIAVAGGMLSGAALVLGGGFWLWRCDRAI